MSEYNVNAILDSMNIAEIENDIIRTAPQSNEEIVGEIAFALRGVCLRTVKQKNPKIKENLLKWLQLFKETKQLYKEIGEQLD